MVAGVCGCLVLVPGTDFGCGVPGRLLPGPGIREAIVLVQDRLDVRITAVSWPIARRVVTGLMILGCCVAGGLLPGGGGVGGESALDVAVVVAGVGVGGAHRARVPRLGVVAAEPLVAC
jgi:hypothetical protein